MLGSVLTRKTRKGDTITFTYDTLNRLATKAAPSEPTVTYTYDLVGRLTSASDTGTVTMSYDQPNRPVGFSFGPAPAAPTASRSGFAYTYDAANRRIGGSATDNSRWSYPTATATTVSYTANNLDQSTAIGAVTPTYDGNGNLTYDGTFTYGYDAESRLTSVTQGGTTVATYAYDPVGHRKAKTVGGGVSAGRKNLPPLEKLWVGPGSFCPVQSGRLDFAAAAVGMWTTRLRCPSEAACPQPDRSAGRGLVAMRKR